MTHKVRDPVRDARERKAEIGGGSHRSRQDEPQVDHPRRDRRARREKYRRFFRPPLNGGRGGESDRHERVGLPRERRERERRCSEADAAAGCEDDTRQREKLRADFDVRDVCCDDERARYGQRRCPQRMRAALGDQPGEKGADAAGKDQVVADDGARQARRAAGARRGSKRGQQDAAVAIARLVERARHLRPARQRIVRHVQILLTVRAGPVVLDRVSLARDERRLRRHQRADAEDRQHGVRRMRERLHDDDGRVKREREHRGPEDAAKHGPSIGHRPAPPSTSR